MGECPLCVGDIFGGGVDGVHKAAGNDVEGASKGGGFVACLVFGRQDSEGMICEGQFQLMGSMVGQPDMPCLWVGVLGDKDVYELWGIHK